MLSDYGIKYPRLQLSVGDDPCKPTDDDAVIELVSKARVSFGKGTSFSIDNRPNMFAPQGLG